jgi:putative ABC transport system permease protein
MTTAISDQRGAPPSADSSLPILEPLGERGSSTVSLGEVVRLAFDSLLSNKVRAFLTMLGVIIGVASVVALLSIGNGASNAITSSVASTGTNVLTIMPGSPQNRGPGSSGSSQNLTLADSEAIAKLNLPIVGPSPQYGGQAQVVAPAADTSATITGVTPVYAEINSLSLQSGSFIDESQVRGSSGVAVLGSTLTETLFGSGEAVGQLIRIKNQTFRVIGVLNAKGSSGFGGSVDDQALVPLTVAQQRLFGARTPDGNGWQISSVAVSVPATDDIKGVTAQIQTLLRERHRLEADGSGDDFNVLDQASLLSTLTTVTSLLTVFLGAVAAISLLVGGIGIMNIMLVSVSERTREIGLRKAVGARGRDILLQFVVEALVLSTSGGLIGLALGSTVPIIITLLGVLDAPVTWLTVLIAVGFAMGVGLFFGIWPARSAAALNPIEALRHE